MAEHDQRFKTLLREFFPDFLRLFFPEHAASFDLDHLEWLEQEKFVAPPHGDVLLLDLVASLTFRAAKGETLALIHIEVESREAVAVMPRRMFDYFTFLRRDFDRPILPIAVYLRVGREGIGVETYCEEIAGLEVLRFQYLYVGLPKLDAESYVQGGNWLGVALAALMRPPPAGKVWLRLEALRRILLECPENEYRRFLLQECVEAYTPLGDEEQQQLERMLHSDPYKELEPMILTTFDKGVAKGRQEGRGEGREEAQRETARLQLERRFGPLNATVLQRLEKWPAEQLKELLLAILDAPSLQALGLAAEESPSNGA
jgi:hypothetical protein